MPTTYLGCSHCGCTETLTRYERLSDYGMGGYYEPYEVCANCGAEWDEAEWCAECDRLLSDCECGRCEDCGELLADCRCADRCPACREWIEDCTCAEAVARSA